RPTAASTSAGWSVKQLCQARLREQRALPARALAVATDLSVELAPFRPNAERQMWRFTEE
ncbi:unnamed protein product, partial [Durusdinium trenchii]